MNKATDKKLNSEQGFTLVEVLMTLAIGLVVTVMFASITINGLSPMRDLRATEHLHSNAEFVSGQFSNLVKQSKEIEDDASDPSVLVLTLHDNSEKVINKNGANIEIDGEPVNNTKVEVEDLNFISLGSSVKASFTLREVATGSELDYSTIITKRNDV